MSGSISGSGVIARVSEKLKIFRKSRKWSQAELAEACGVTQSQVSRWEKGLDRPQPAALAAIAQLADDTERGFWLNEAGVAQFVTADTEATRVVPLLRDAAAAGTPRAIDESNIEMTLALPTAWLPTGGKLYMIHVVGDSMAPVINDGNIVLVDVAERKPENLVGWMVAAREGDGVTIKYLRRDADFFFLVPQHTSERHPIRVLRNDGNWSVIGKVVKIISDPPPPKKR